MSEVWGPRLAEVRFIVHDVEETGHILALANIE